MLVGLGRVDLIKNKIYFRIFFFVAIMLTTTSIIIMLLGNDTGTLLLPRRRSTNRGLIILTSWLQHWKPPLPTLPPLVRLCASFWLTFLCESTGDPIVSLQPSVAASPEEADSCY